MCDLYSACAMSVFCPFCSSIRRHCVTVWPLGRCVSSVKHYRPEEKENWKEKEKKKNRGQYIHKFQRLPTFFSSHNNVCVRACIHTHMYPPPHTHHRHARTHKNPDFSFSMAAELSSVTKRVRLPQGAFDRKKRLLLYFPGNTKRRECQGGKCCQAKTMTSKSCKEAG